MIIASDSHGNTWDWDPEPDITALELARLMPLLLRLTAHVGAAGLSTEIEALSDELRRHFTTYPPNETPPELKLYPTPDEYIIWTDNNTEV